MLRTWPHSVIRANYEWISCSEPKKKIFCQVLPTVVAFKEKLPMPLLLPQPILND